MGNKINESMRHAGGWSVNATVTIPDWDRHSLERLVRYCARPPLSQERLGRFNDETLVSTLRKPTVDGRTELILRPLELLDRLSKLITPPQVEMDFDQVDAGNDWPDMDQTGGTADETWN